MSGKPLSADRQDQIDHEYERVYDACAQPTTAYDLASKLGITYKRVWDICQRLESDGTLTVDKSKRYVQSVVNRICEACTQPKTCAELADKLAINYEKTFEICQNLLCAGILELINVPPAMGKIFFKLKRA
jgi:predicted ArsR family transcriptional regulator